MSSKTSGNAIRNYLEKVNSSNIIQKQNELKQVISGPLALAREKTQIIESDEASSVLSRIDADYFNLLKRSIANIFFEELEKADLLLNDIDSILKELQDLLDTTEQRIFNEKRRSLDVNFVSNIYEEARSILVFLKLKTNLLRSCLEVTLDEPVVKINLNSELEIAEGDFLYSLGKLETSCLILGE